MTQNKLLATAKKEITAAWKSYQKVEKYGLEFGATVYKWREEFASKSRGIGTKGKGLSPILDTIGIPKSTAYWWINRYEVSLGLRAAPTPKELEDSDDEGFPVTEFDMSAEDIEKLLEAGRKREAKWAAANPALTVQAKLTPEVRKAAHALIEMGYRVLAKSLHPDVGGNHSGMSDLNVAVAWLRTLTTEELAQ